MNARSVQLYTLRELTGRDFAGCLRSVREIGFEAVELAGYGSLKTAAEARRAADDAGLVVSGMHAGIDLLEADAQKVLDDAHALGTRHVIVPFLAESRRQDAAGWKQVAQSLDRVGRACHARGVTLSYHNHSFEFKSFEGKKGLDILLENSDPALLKAELDVYWVRHGGEDPVQRIESLGSRLSLLHLKDMAAGDERRFAEVGTGVLDFPAILAAGKRAGAEWGIVEQDNTYGTPPLEAVRRSFENLKKLGA